MSDMKDMMVYIPLSTAVIVSDVFLPANPNKLRTATPEVIEAAHAFKNAVRDALLKYWSDKP